MSGFKCPYCDGTGELLDQAATMGARILSARKAAGLTQQELASLVGRSRPQIANIEAGRTDIPVSLLALFARSLKVKAGELLP